MLTASTCMRFRYDQGRKSKLEGVPLRQQQESPMALVKKLSALQIILRVLSWCGTRLMTILNPSVLTLFFNLNFTFQLNFTFHIILYEFQLYSIVIR